MTEDFSIQMALKYIYLMWCLQPRNM